MVCISPKPTSQAHSHGKSIHLWQVLVVIILHWDVGASAPELFSWTLHRDKAQLYQLLLAAGSGFRDTGLERLWSLSLWVQPPSTANTQARNHLDSWSSSISTVIRFLCPISIAGKLFQNLTDLMLEISFPASMHSWPVHPHLFLCQLCHLT